MVAPPERRDDSDTNNIISGTKQRNKQQHQNLDMDSSNSNSNSNTLSEILAIMSDGNLTNIGIAPAAGATAAGAGAGGGGGGGGGTTFRRQDQQHQDHAVSVPCPAAGGQQGDENKDEGNNMFLPGGGLIVLQERQPSLTSQITGDTDYYYRGTREYHPHANADDDTDDDADDFLPIHYPHMMHLMSAKSNGNKSTTKNGVGVLNRQKSASMRRRRRRRRRGGAAATAAASGAANTTAYVQKKNGNSIHNDSPTLCLQIGAVVDRISTCDMREALEDTCQNLYVSTTTSTDSADSSASSTNNNNNNGCCIMPLLDYYQYRHDDNSAIVVPAATNQHRQHEEGNQTKSMKDEEFILKQPQEQQQSALRTRSTLKADMDDSSSKQSLDKYKSLNVSGSSGSKRRRNSSGAKISEQLQQVVDTEPQPPQQPQPQPQNVEKHRWQHPSWEGADANQAQENAKIKEGITSSVLAKNAPTADSSTNANKDKTPPNLKTGDATKHKSNTAIRASITIEENRSASTHSKKQQRGGKNEVEPPFDEKHEVKATIDEKNEVEAPIDEKNEVKAPLDEKKTAAAKTGGHNNTTYSAITEPVLLHAATPDKEDDQWCGLQHAFEAVFCKKQERTSDEAINNKADHLPSPQKHQSEEDDTNRSSREEEKDDEIQQQAAVLVQNEQVHTATNTLFDSDQPQCLRGFLRTMHSTDGLTGGLSGDRPFMMCTTIDEESSTTLPLIATFSGENNNNNNNNGYYWWYDRNKKGNSAVGGKGKQQQSSEKNSMVVRNDNEEREEKREGPDSSSSSCRKPDDQKMKTSTQIQQQQQGSCLDNTTTTTTTIGRAIMQQMMIFCVHDDAVKLEGLSYDTNISTGTIAGGELLDHRQEAARTMVVPTTGVSSNQRDLLAASAAGATAKKNICLGPISGCVENALLDQDEDAIEVVSPSTFKRMIATSRKKAHADLKKKTKKKAAAAAVPMNTAIALATETKAATKEVVPSSSGKRRQLLSRLRRSRGRSKGAVQIERNANSRNLKIVAEE